MKKNTYKISLILIVLLVSVFVFSGCNKTTNQETVTPTPVPDTGNQEQEEDETNEDADTDTEEGGTQTEPEVIKAHYGTVEVQQDIIYSEDFEDGQTQFTGRGPAKVQIVDNQAGEGTKSLYVTERTSLWNGATVNLTEELKIGETYLIEAMVLYEEGPDTVGIDCKLEKNSSEYLSFASSIAKKGEWGPITGSIIIPEGTTTASVYFETGYAEGELIDFYIDGIKIVKEIATVDRGELPSLKEVYKDLYSVGVAVTANEISANRQELIKQQFNSLTPGNELKPDSVLDRAICISDPKYDDNPAVDFSRVEPILEFAQEAGIPVRGHTLVWHSQTPRWFFAEGYSDDANAPLVSKDLMLKRMENYIKNVLEYTQTNYPDLIYAWDVVNEAVNPSDGAPNGYRSKDSLWYQVVGPEFVEKAFEYARKYADENVKLFYNDYNTEDSARMIAIYDIAAGLKEKGLIDGIGLQSHFSMENPSLIDVESSIRKYAELGLEIQITELDMGLTENTEEAYLRQAKRYKRFFAILKNLKESGNVNVTNLTFWGLSDDISWLNKPDQPSYPLLFDKYLLQKPAFWAAVLSPDIPLY
ncbi:endo-1,4-beta-xylanase [Mobilitalea sibirica]|uniref:Beta-xylanase n=1 Tax=Mobilitalea sibirica TaxID=1462919 RepID=A0A8J7H215_9FIRM|nr:endo-1,4-beta-xylanase [Mobilitalea sibirica]MBH1940667.1 endo-1,4-beta-xylanase [Mobilitalea sibirica]